MSPIIMFIVGGNRTHDFGRDILWSHRCFVRYFQLCYVVSVDTIFQSLWFLSWCLW